MSNLDGSSRRSIILCKFPNKIDISGFGFLDIIIQDIKVRSKTSLILFTFLEIHALDVLVLPVPQTAQGPPLHCQPT